MDKRKVIAAQEQNNEQKLIDLTNSNALIIADVFENWAAVPPASAIYYGDIIKVKHYNNSDHKWSEFYRCDLVDPTDRYHFKWTLLFFREGVEYSEGLGITSVKRIEKISDIEYYSLEQKDPNTLYLLYERDVLKFTAKEDNSSVGYTINGTISCDIYYSKNNGDWTSWDGSSINLNNDEFIKVWNKENRLNTGFGNYLNFRMQGSIEASGDVNSMINFNSVLSNYCYSNMFGGCASLTVAPELPATNLSNYCYRNMFSGCTSLTVAPELPATNLAYHCYNCMFSGCTSLTTAPELPATNLVRNCYRLIFDGCTNLEQIKLHYTGNFSMNYFDDWVSGVNKSGVIYYNGSDTTRGNSAIPQNFAVQTF